MICAVGKWIQLTIINYWYNKRILILWAWGMKYIFYWYYIKKFTWICVVCLTIRNKVSDINLSIYLFILHESQIECYKMCQKGLIIVHKM